MKFLRQSDEKKIMKSAECLEIKELLELNVKPVTIEIVNKKK